MVPEPPVPIVAETRLAAVAANEPPISTLPAVAPMVETNLNVSLPTVIVSLARKLFDAVSVKTAVAAMAAVFWMPSVAAVSVPSVTRTT